MDGAITGRLADNRLPVLQAEIAELHRRGDASQQEALTAYREAGAKLIEAKGLLGHGQWLPWLGEIGIEPRTAQRYMRLAQIPADKYDTVTHLGLRAALDSIAAHHATPEKERRRPLEDGELEIPLNDVKFRPELYSRQPTSKGGSFSQDGIDRYVALLPYLDAIEINQRFEIIDGYMRYLAHQKAKTFKTIRVRITEVKDDLEHLKLAISRNSTHGEPLPIEKEIEVTEDRWRQKLLAAAD